MKPVQFNIMKVIEKLWFNSFVNTLLRLSVRLCGCDGQTIYFYTTRIIALGARAKWQYEWSIPHIQPLAGPWVSHSLQSCQVDQKCDC